MDNGNVRQLMKSQADIDQMLKEAMDTEGFLINQDNELNAAPAAEQPPPKMDFGSRLKMLQNRIAADEAPKRKLRF